MTAAVVDLGEPAGSRFQDGHRRIDVADLEQIRFNRGHILLRQSS